MHAQARNISRLLTAVTIVATTAAASAQWLELIEYICNENNRYFQIVPAARPYGAHGTPKER